MSPSLRARVSCGLHPVRASTPGPTGGFSRLEDLNSRCWRGRQPPPRDSPVWSCLGHGATVEKLGQSFNTCEISDKNLDFQFLFKPLQTVPHSPSHLPYRVRAWPPASSLTGILCLQGWPPCENVQAWGREFGGDPSSWSDGHQKPKPGQSYRSPSDGRPGPRGAGGPGGRAWLLAGHSPLPHPVFLVLCFRVNGDEASVGKQAPGPPHWEVRTPCQRALGSVTFCL